MTEKEIAERELEQRLVRRSDGINEAEAIVSVFRRLRLAEAVVAATAAWWYDMNRTWDGSQAMVMQKALDAYRKEER